MAREDWQDPEQATRRKMRRDLGQVDFSEDYVYDPHDRRGYRAEPETRTDDYGQADYAQDFAYDAEGRRAYRRESDGGHDERGAPEHRSWMDRAGEFFSGHGPRQSEGRPRHVRRGPSDRVLWAVVMERLEDQRRLDLRHVHVSVRDAEVTLNGWVRTKVDKRRVEDVADIDGVRHVQNNLRVRDRHWIFL